MKKIELGPNSFGMATAAVAVIAGVLSLGWGGYGMMAMMGVAYPGVMLSPGFAVLGLLGTIVAAYLIGYVFATVYNYAENKRG